jgi:carbamate kinase
VGPKIEAIISFLAHGGERRAIITNRPASGAPLSGAAGTHITPD